MQEIDAGAWNRLAGSNSPFLKHEFLLALEQSGSVSAETGWQPCHLAVFAEDSKQLLAAMPLYLKNHSYGEYVFDWSWADAYQRHGHAYYPKLLTAIPFTPSQSPRVLADSPERMQALMPHIISAVMKYAEQSGASSWHILFPDTSASALFAKAGLVRREACQFHWRNRDYQSFDGFLDTFSSRKRKNLRKERADVKAQGISFERLQGEEISDAIWDRFYQFYQNTYHIRGQHGYLTRDFFRQIHASMPEAAFLVMAQRHGEYIAGALFFEGAESLFGRYWGASDDYQNLHFETCYYQGIEYCIEHQLTLFDAGAQGEHKLRRGFEPVSTESYHWIQEPAFRHAIADFCAQEIDHVRTYKEAAVQQLPFKRPDND